MHKATSAALQGGGDSSYFNAVALLNAGVLISFADDSFLKKAAILFYSCSTLGILQNDFLNLNSCHPVS